MAKTGQVLLDYPSIEINFKGITTKGLDDYYAKGVAIERIYRQIGPEFGSGSPEGTVFSGLSRIYVDSDTNTMYANPNVGVKTGWVAV